MDLGIFYREYKRHLDAARTAHSEGDFPQARDEYLRAARLLLGIAQKTAESDLKRTRVSNAKRLTDIAEKLRDRPRTKRKPQPLTPEQAEARLARHIDDAFAEKTDSGLATPSDDDPVAGPVDGLDAPLPDVADATQEAAEVGAEAGDQWLLAERPKVRFDDIAGLDEAKEQIELRMILPLAHPEKAQAYGIRLGGGVLLYGPPGTGKTMLARAVAGEIDAAFYTVTPADVLSKYVGESEHNLDTLFESARRHPKSVIFIDEVESLVPRRERMEQSPVMQRLVPQLLAALDGVDSEGKNPLLFVGATNEPWTLDPAVLRPGRFDARIYIGLPEPAARLTILASQLRERPLADDVNLDRLSDRLTGCSGADVVGLCRRVSADVFLRAIESEETLPMTWADFERGLSALQPSVTPALLEKFQNFRSGGNG